MDISHERAKEAALRLIRGAFRRDGERLDFDKRPQFSIPCRPDQDDDTVIIAYIEQQAALAKRDEEVAQAVAAERAAWEAELRPLIEAGAFEGVLFTACEQCGALLTDDEVAPVEDGPKGCWRAATGRDKDPCPGEGRKRITATLTKEPTNAE